MNLQEVKKFDNIIVLLATGGLYYYLDPWHICCDCTCPTVILTQCLLTVLVPIVESRWRFGRGSIAAASARSPSMPMSSTRWCDRPPVKTLLLGSAPGQEMVASSAEEEDAYAAAAPRRSSVKETSDARDGVVGSQAVVVVEATVATDCRAARRRKTRGDGGGDFMVAKLVND